MVFDPKKRVKPEEMGSLEWIEAAEGMVEA